MDAAHEREENKFNNCEGFRTENGSSQGQNLALTGLCVPRSLKSDIARPRHARAQGFSKPGELDDRGRANIAQTGKSRGREEEEEDEDEHANQGECGGRRRRKRGWGWRRGSGGGGVGEEEEQEGKNDHPPLGFRVWGFTVDCAQSSLEMMIFAPCAAATRERHMVRS